MIIYIQEQEKIEKKVFSLHEEIPENMVWIDLENISLEEEKKLEDYFLVDIPTPEETKNVSVSNRLYEKQGSIFMTITLYLNKKNNSVCNFKAHTLTFVVIKGILITIRDFKSDLFDNLLSHIEPKHIASGNISLSILLILLENIINDTSACLERIGHHLDSQNDMLIKTSPAYNQANNVNYKTLLKRITNLGNSISKIRESLITSSRMLNFLLQLDSLNQKKDFIFRIKIFLRDVNALSDQATFLSNKTGFLLEANLGLINIEQNNIIKIFSLSGLIFMPATLIASIYGMNFEIMPELKWVAGYPASLILMLIASWVPYKYYKKKNWL